MAFNLIRRLRGGAPVEAAAADHPLADDIAAKGFVGQHGQGDEFVSADATARSAGPGTERGQVAEHGQMQHPSDGEIREPGPSSADHAVMSGSGWGTIFRDDSQRVPVENQTAERIVGHGMVPERGLDADATARTAGSGAEHDRIAGIKFDGIDGEVAPDRGTPLGSVVSNESGAVPGSADHAVMSGSTWGTIFRDDSQGGRVENQVAERIVGHGMLPERGLVENQTADPDAAARTAGPGTEPAGSIKFDGVDGEIRAPAPAGMIHDTALALRDAGSDSRGTAPAHPSNVIETTTGGIEFAHDEGPTTLLSHATGAGDLAKHAGGSPEAFSLNFEDVVHHSPVPDAPDGVVDLPDGADIDPLDI